MVTQEQRNKAYETASLSVKNLYGEPEIGKRLGEIIEQFQIPERAQGGLIHTYGDIVLGLFEKTDTSKLLTERTELSQDIIEQITTALIGLLDEVLLQATPDLNTQESPPPEKNDDAVNEQQFPRKDSNAQTNLPTKTPGPEPEQAAEEEPIPEPTPIPSYKKPLTEIPRYDNTYQDPYHERPDEQRD